MPITNISNLALATIDALSERDWCGGQPENEEGHVCLVGAVNVAAYGLAMPSDTDAEDYHTPAVIAMADALLATGVTDRYYGFGDPVSAMYGWNDNPHRTAVQIVAALVIVSQECGWELDLALD